MKAGSTFAIHGSNGNVNNNITLSMVITCIIAASCGLISGYEGGVIGGVTTTASFLRKFFPSILRKLSAAGISNMYCLYDSQALTAFTSSVYIAGLVTSLIASRLTNAIGRRNIMFLGGLTYFVGASINGGAVNVPMLIIGHILLGFGLGFTVQASPVYLSEVAPPKWRGAFNTGFQFCLGIGVAVASCVNYITSKHTWGWRLSLGFAVVPAAIMTIGALFITDTPSSLVERGKLDKAKQSLVKIRGVKDDADAELTDLIKAKETAKAVDQDPFVTIFKREYRPQLVMTIAIPLFQQTTGITIISFYAPAIFRSAGHVNDSVLLSGITLGVLHMCSIAIAACVVDRYGRRALFIHGGIQMFLAKVAIACVLAATTDSGTKQISEGYAKLILALMCTYVVGYGLSWGPLSWLIITEVYPLKLRSTGQSITVAINYAVTIVLSQVFFTMLCHFKFGVFLFYAGWIATMTIFVVLFLPETKGIPLDSMHVVWEKHWYWRRFVVPAQHQEGRHTQK